MFDLVYVFPEVRCPQLNTEYQMWPNWIQIFGLFLTMKALNNFAFETTADLPKNYFLCFPYSLGKLIFVTKWTTLHLFLSGSIIHLESLFDSAKITLYLISFIQCIGCSSELYAICTLDHHSSCIIFNSVNVTENILKT